MAECCTYAVGGVTGSGKPRYGSHVNQPTTPHSAAPSKAKPLSSSGKAYEAPGDPKGFTSNHHVPLLTPVPHDQKRTY